jgi:peroxiredoxin
MRTFAVLLVCAVVLAAADNVRRAPGFALPDSKMEVYDLADYRGKVVILEFMQTTCPHCATFAGILNEAQKKYGDRIAILAVANSMHDNQNTVAQYVAGHQVKYPVLFDSGQMAFSYVRSMSFDNPHVYLIDQQGMIRGDFGYSPMSKEIFEGAGLYPEIDRLLGGAGKKR